MSDNTKTNHLKCEIEKINNHVQLKIERLDERMRFANYKFEDVRYYFRKYSISIIYLATLLTLIEAFLNTLSIETIQPEILQNVIKFCPLVLSSLVSLLAAIIKFNKYEEKIEHITRATEKCITTIAKLKEVKEELFFCENIEKLNTINDTFLRTIYRDYLDSNTSVERELLDTDYAKYMKKIAKNDIARAKTVIEKKEELQNLTYNPPNGVEIINRLTKLFQRPTKERSVEIPEIIPFRGGSPGISRYNSPNVSRPVTPTSFKSDHGTLSDINMSRSSMTRSHQELVNLHNIPSLASATPQKNIEMTIDILSKNEIISKPSE